jgi:hypothetical protein
MAAADRRKPVVLGAVFLAGLVAAGATVKSLASYIDWVRENSDCKGELMVEQAKDRMAVSLVRQRAQALEAELEKTNGLWKVSVRAEGRSLVYSYRFKNRVATDTPRFYQANSIMQKQLLGDYCSRKYWDERGLNVTETHTVYSSEGERLMSFSITPANCPQ